MDSKKAFYSSNICFFDFPGSLLFGIPRINVLSAYGHNIQYINTHWRQPCLLESQVLQGYKSHLKPCKAQDT